MLLSSYFILNKYVHFRTINIVAQVSIPLARTNEIKKHKLYPHVHSFSNVPTRKAMLCPVHIPDVLPSTLPPGTDFSLVAGEFSSSCGMISYTYVQLSGDFEEIYGTDTDPNEPHAGQWDAILTCFFIDTVRILFTSLASAD